MLTIQGQKQSLFCDGLSRRSLLRIGAFGLGSLALPDLFRVEARAGANAKRTKGLINIFLAGGPPHLDMFDLKPDAPSEFRGEFSPIKTNVPGMDICEQLPRLATVADKFTVVRSVVGTYDRHTRFHCQVGWDEEDLKGVGGYPALGSVISKVYGSHEGAPPFVSLMGPIKPGFVGPSHASFLPEGEGRDNLTLKRLSSERLYSRTGLLKSLDGIKREIDATGAMEAMDSFTQRAVDVVTSGRVADALDLDKEPAATRARYTAGSHEYHVDAERLLLARRLIEAGVRVVSVQLFGWDTHRDNFGTLRRQLPVLDAGLSALLRDLSERGMLDDVTVVMWGEFGRTPRINQIGGRDHWPRVMQAVLAGGGMRNGQVIGSTDRYGGEAADRPVHFREVFATLYHNLGIDAKNTTLPDPAGRPQYLVDGYDPIRELVG